VRAGVNGYFEKKSSRTWTIVRRYFPDEKSVGEIWLMFRFFLILKKSMGRLSHHPEICQVSGNIHIAPATQKTLATPTTNTLAHCE
jgi:hypothetical protein